MNEIPDSDLSSLAAALAPTAEAPQTPVSAPAPLDLDPDSIPDVDPIQPSEKPIEPGHAWDDGREDSREPEPVAKAKATEKAPVTDDDFDARLMSELGIPPTSREGMKSLKAALKEAKAKIEELSKQPAKPSEDAAKIRAEYEAIAKIRESEAFGKEVYEPQAQALAKAKKIGRAAYLEDSEVEELFKAENEYDLEKNLLALNDPAAYHQLKPLAFAALEAREKGMSVIKSSDPIKELAEWQAKSAKVSAERQQQQLAQEVEIDSAVFQEVFNTKISQSPIAKTDFGKAKFEAVLNKIQGGGTIQRDDVLRGLYELEVSPVKDALIMKNAQRIAELEAQLNRLGGGSLPSPKAPTVSRVQAGALAPGSAWDDGR